MEHGLRASLCSLGAPLFGRPSDPGMRQALGSIEAHPLTCCAHSAAVPAASLAEAAKWTESMVDGSGSSVERSRRTLQSLAETLGCATEIFFGETPPDHLAAAEELLPLWLAIPDSSERRRVLDFARAVKAAADSKIGDA